jgi:hypothetical protein
VNNHSVSRHHTVAWLSTRPTAHAIEPACEGIIAHRRLARNASTSGRNRRHSSATSSALMPWATTLLACERNGSAPAMVCSTQKLSVTNGR